MLFNSWQFAVFFPVVFALYWFMPQRFRIYLLFAASYYFYMSWNAKYVVLILFTTIVSYFAAILLEKYRAARKLILVIALVSCLGVLFVFKYFNFISETLVNFLNMFASIKLHPMTLKLLLPVGISFYTFQTLSYVIDVYKGQEKAERNFIVYATFISFFPQLVAGPIERTKNLMPQIKNCGLLSFKYEQGVYGLKLILLGLFKKIAVADCLAIWVDGGFAKIESYSGFVLIILLGFFAVQIYCDFSGYSDIARGCAKLLGIDLMINFRSPYFASSIREYWQRWHISLSTWFRDYVYIPLGGSRVGKIRHYINLLITFMISGLWHGANITFLLWGAVHGLAQIIENFLNLNRRRNFLSVIIVFAFTCLAWAFFRTQTLNEAIHIFSHLFDGITNIKSYLYNGIQGIKSLHGNTQIPAALIISVAILDYLAVNYDDFAAWLKSKLASKNIILRWSVYVLLIWVFIGSLGVLQGDNTEFIYFQF
ncbi:MAG: MBOAT family protein [Synergistaceae bacterium]|nr:MBOAT family protein [Synergistaceae bacterium]